VLRYLCSGRAKKLASMQLIFEFNNIRIFACQGKIFSRKEVLRGDGKTLKQVLDSFKRL
jgi:hypothetical protein